MANTVVNQTNINFLTKAQYDALTPNNNELYAVKVGSVIVETYVNGDSWYRIYSDGWCEQGGFHTESSSAINISFLKKFSNTPNVTFGTICSTVDNSSRTVNMTQLNTSGFTAYTKWAGATSTGVGGAIRFYWKAFGQIA